MKVTLFRDLPSERWPSMERYADELARHLPPLSPALHITSYVLPTPLKPRNRLGVLSTQAWRSAIYPFTAKRHQSDLNHIVDHSYAHLVHFLDARRTIVTCHDLAPLALRDIYRGRGPSLRLWGWSFAGLLKAAHVICDSLFTASELLRLSHYPAHQISVVPLGVDPSFRRIAARDTVRGLRERFALPSDRPLLLHVGHCGARKNVEGLLAALSLVKCSGQLFHFMQIGGQFTAAQRALIAKDDLQSELTQIMYAPESDLPTWYNLADLFIFPSTYEGFGLPVLEAMACGTPVICSRAGSLPEVAGDAAMFVDAAQPESIAEAVRVLLSSASLRAEFAAKGLTRASLFTWEHCARETFAVYQHLAESSL